MKPWGGRGLPTRPRLPWVLWLPLLAAAACNGERLPSATARIRITPDLELTFQYPSAWTYERDGDMLVFKARRGPDAAVPTLFVQTRRADGGWDLSREVTKILAQHRQEAQSSLEDERWEEVMGSPAYRFGARFSMAGVPYRMNQEIVSRVGRFFYFSYVAPASAFEDGRSAFEEVIATMRFGPPEGSTSDAAPERRDGASLVQLREVMALAYYAAVLLAAGGLVIVLARRRRRGELSLELLGRHLGQADLLHVELTVVNRGRRRIVSRRLSDSDADGLLRARSGVAVGFEVRQVGPRISAPAGFAQLAASAPPVDFLAGAEGVVTGVPLVLEPGDRQLFSAIVPVRGPGAVLVRAFVVGRTKRALWERVVAVPLETGATINPDGREPDPDDPA